MDVLFKFHSISASNSRSAVRLGGVRIASDDTMCHYTEVKGSTHHDMGSHMGHAFTATILKLILANVTLHHKTNKKSHSPVLCYG